MMGGPADYAVPVFGIRTPPGTIQPTTELTVSSQTTKTVVEMGNLSPEGEAGDQEMAPANLALL